jgi:hypothetical protein
MRWRSRKWLLRYWLPPVSLAARPTLRDAGWPGTWRRPGAPSPGRGMIGPWSRCGPGGLGSKGQQACLSSPCETQRESRHRDPARTALTPRRRLRCREREVPAPGFGSTNHATTRRTGSLSLRRPGPFPLLLSALAVAIETGCTGVLPCPRRTIGVRRGATGAVHVGPGARAPACDRSDGARCLAR